ncbi:MAG: hypothetical protein R2867_16780 [Caldilineaceae bacterium]
MPKSCCNSWQPILRRRGRSSPPAHGQPGRSAHPDMRTVAAEFGLDLAAHRARNVDNVDLAAYDLILTMEQSHKEAMQIEFPAVRGAFICSVKCWG